MKPPLAQYLIAALFYAAATSARAGDFKSEVIQLSSPLTINVPDDRFLVIRNFTQQGGMTRGVVNVTINGRTANVLAAAIIDSGTPTPTPAPLEVINNVVIAGPATVTVTCPSDAMCFITYRKGSD